MQHEEYFKQAVDFLQKLISVPSLSNEEEKVAELWIDFLHKNDVKNVNRYHNNVYAITENFDPHKPIVLLNSHMDTVKPSASYTRDPFNPEIEDGKLYGLGSNDAGGSGVSLATVFLKFKDDDSLPFNLLLCISASEEKMGATGMQALLPHLKEKGLYPDFAIVGEPTECKAAIAERGLVVCDASVKGVAGHAARDKGDGNAIYRSFEDIEILRNLKTEKVSEVLGPLKVSVTMIEAGTQHNVIPDSCKYVVDMRTTDAYTNEESVEILNKAVKWSEFTPRSTRIRASVLDNDSPLVIAAKKIELETFISPTTSDMALMYDIPSIKIGPGKSERSHTADEFIFLEEIERGIKTYENFIRALSI